MFYTWTEDQAGQEATEVSFAILHYLKSANLASVKQLCFFCDRCKAQNKNNIVVHALMYYLGTTCNNDLTETVLYSFLPTDHFFWEKKLWQKLTVATKEEYTKNMKLLARSENWVMNGFLKTLNCCPRNGKLWIWLAKKRIISTKEEEIIKNMNQTSKVVKVKALQNIRFRFSMKIKNPLSWKMWVAFFKDF